ncbi:hypothetical protein Poly24_09020 [Rosistilla carotiformis]|uniref:TIGR02453 family protein n=1 Tax=Rosistilla carotiformis TaxID=2528017 RepID=A0A518JNT8_9BACT|nr:DUF2461 domain-containing protein [Rosistilla carotiformis]QDV67209.1 hypothetical protein Poly24_09020 [Rosistilla carotiformis]
MSSRSMYTDDCLQFLEELRHNNDRQWFAENKERYEASVREPSLRLIEAIGPRLEKLSPFFPAVAKRVGGSLMRIHRDTRFAKDKTPYKTNIGIQFRHEAGKDVHAPGFYVHFEPERCFVGAGCWHPDSQALLAIRRKIDDEPTRWKRARDAKAFRENYRLEGESLKTTPRDFFKDHPLIDDLRRKDFIGLSPLAESDVTSPDLVTTILAKFRAARALMQFLCESGCVPF